MLAVWSGVKACCCALLKPASWVRDGPAICSSVSKGIAARDPTQVARLSDEEGCDFTALGFTVFAMVRPGAAWPQAKARLAEMRASQPDARLADAQFALAREYGFSSWGKMRAEVFRCVTTARDREFRARRHGTPRTIRDRERDYAGVLLEQTMHIESQTAFFLSGANTNIGILFVLIIIVMSLWVFSSALPG